MRRFEKALIVQPLDHQQVGRGMGQQPPVGSMRCYSYPPVPFAGIHVEESAGFNVPMLDTSIDTSIHPNVDSHQPGVARKKGVINVKVFVCPALKSSRNNQCRLLVPCTTIDYR